VTCHRCNLSLCACDVIADRYALFDYVIVALCVAVYAGAFAMACWPPGSP
jgi:hypothetical protein